MGRPRLKGSRLPNLSVMLEDPKTDYWTPVTVSGWYGGEERAVEIVSQNSNLVLHGLARCAIALGAHPRST